MVAVINVGGSILRTLNYNENKVKENAAKCIGASGYPKDHDQLSFAQKYNRLIRQAALSTSVKKNSVHISLNFAPQDFPAPSKDTSAEQREAIERDQEEKLNKIAVAYMNKIGFGNQPYLVYKHEDAGHPHVHVVTLKTDEKGNRIETNNIGRNESFQASRELELAFGLTVATKKNYSEVYQISPVNVEKVVYGRSPTKRAITNVLDAVLKSYKYASLPELNAILGMYNIVAYQSKESTTNKGLYYRLIGATGEKIGKPIKASDIYSKPTLKYLQERFIDNSKGRTRDKRQLANTIHLILLGKPSTFETFSSSLEKKGIHVVPRYTKTGEIYGLTYVDHNTKSVFNGRVLGTAYSAKAILDSIQTAAAKILPDLTEPNNEVFKPSQTDPLHPELPYEQAEQINQESIAEELIDILFHTEYTNPNLPYPLRAKKKRKKKK